MDRLARLCVIWHAKGCAERRLVREAEVTGVGACGIVLPPGNLHSIVDRGYETSPSRRTVLPGRTENSGGPLILTFGSWFAYVPSWSPEGMMISFIDTLSRINSHCGVCGIRLASGCTRVTHQQKAHGV